MDGLLHVLNADRADRLQINVGTPPVIVIGGEPHPVEGLAVTLEMAERLLQSICTTRQRRELRERGRVQFVYRFQERTDFVVCATVDGEDVAMDIH